MMSCASGFLVSRSWGNGGVVALTHSQLMSPENKQKTNRSLYSLSNTIITPDTTKTWSKSGKHTRYTLYIFYPSFVVLGSVKERIQGVLR
jgi:hypothetical protein